MAMLKTISMSDERTSRTKLARPTEITNIWLFENLARSIRAYSKMESAQWGIHFKYIFESYYINEFLTLGFDLSVNL